MLLIPAFSIFLFTQVGWHNVQGRQWVMLRVRDEKGEQSKAHIYCGHERRTSANEGIKEEWGVKYVGI